ncbi:MAG: PTS sugar transporter subunit IIA [Planctomycetales bacterium]|nr:PTS sugar transporter subunit IIA [Planctomycetales bacterium]
MESGLVRDRGIAPALAAATRDAALRELTDLLAGAEPDLGLDREALVRALVDREALGSTAIGQGIAVPHCKLRGVPRIVGAFGRSAAGVDFQARDGRPVRLFFLVVSPIEASGPHIRVLATISRIAREEALRERLLAAPGAAEIHRALLEAGL